MDERARSLERACQALAPHWSEARSARLYAATVRLRSQRDARRVASYTVATFAAAVVLGAGLQGVRYRDVLNVLGADTTAPVPSAHTLRLSDGSRAELRGDKSEIEAIEDRPDLIVLRLASGRAHFDVVPNPQRSFVVEVPPYRVQVIGTIFDIDRSEQGVRVDVTRGSTREEGCAFGTAAGAREHPTHSVPRRAATPWRAQPRHGPSIPHRSARWRLRSFAAHFQH